MDKIVKSYMSVTVELTIVGSYNFSICLDMYIIQRFLQLMHFKHVTCPPAKQDDLKETTKKDNMEILEHKLLLLIPKIKYIGHVA